MPFDGRNNEAIALVEKTEQLINRPEKWLKHTAKYADSFCLYGALYEAAGYDGNHWFPSQVTGAMATVNLAFEQEAARRGFSYGDPAIGVFYNGVKFNNAPSTTHADMLDFFRSVKQRLAVAA